MISKIFVYYYLITGLLTVLCFLFSELRPSKREEFLEGMELLAVDSEFPLWGCYFIMFTSLFVGGFIFLPLFIVSRILNKVNGSDYEEN